MKPYDPKQGMFDVERGGVIDTDGVVHGVKLIKDRMRSWCDRPALTMIYRGGVYVQTCVVVTCIPCLVDQPTEPHGVP